MDRNKQQEQRFRRRRGGLRYWGLRADADRRKFGNRTGRPTSAHRTESTTLNTAVLAPIPSPSVMTTVSVKTGACRKGSQRKS